MGEKKHEIIKEKVKDKQHEFIYAEVDIRFLVNDKKCQPRNINLTHLWNIFKDIQSNPLHEAPACRINPESKTNEQPLLLFDGQHKALAFLLDGRKQICVKIYLNLSEAEANALVNSIQSKIKKLPLTPFELASKMSEEWLDKHIQYLQTPAPHSESKFLEWIPAEDRKRAKEAFVEALFHQIMKSSDVEMLKFVKNQKKQETIKITEATFQNKILKNLLRLEPLKAEFRVSNPQRKRETKYIIKALNIFNETCLLPKSGSELTDSEKQKNKLITYQSSLNYIAVNIKKLLASLIGCEQDEAFYKKEISSTVWGNFQKGMQRLSEHPFWKCDLTSTETIRTLNDALQKNQNAADSFRAVGLDVGYLNGSDELTANWNE